MVKGTVTPTATAAVPDMGTSTGTGTGPGTGTSTMTVVWLIEPMTIFPRPKSGHWAPLYTPGVVSRAEAALRPVYGLPRIPPPPLDFSITIVSRTG